MTDSNGPLPDTARRPRLIPWAEIKDNLFGPIGTAERAQHDAAVAEISRRNKRNTRLTSWLNLVPPRWIYRVDEVGGVRYEHKQGIGSPAAVFWLEALEALGNRSEYDSVREWITWSGYHILDAFAFCYFDDAYVPWPREAGKGLRTNWRRTEREAIAGAKAELDELKAAGLLED
jgi:hypothetical protein